MLVYRLALKSFVYYLSRNILLALGVALTTMVIAGSLIVGDSIKHSLLRVVYFRLGNTEMTINAGDRFFKASLSQRIAEKSNILASSILKLDGIAVKEGGALRLPNIQILGVDSMFYYVTGASTNLFTDNAGEVVISQNIADLMNFKLGDKFILQITKASAISFETPFVTDDERYVSILATVKGIADKNEMGRFNIQNSQSASYNVFIDLKQLNKLTGLNSKANLVIISDANYADKESVVKSLNEIWSYEDAGYKIEHIENTDEWSISSERIFIDKSVGEDFINKNPFTLPIFTYFVNSISNKEKTTPYSFVSSIADSSLKDDEIVITSWLADDLGAKQGDTLSINYFDIELLRSLTKLDIKMRVAEVVPFTGRFADSTLMPYIQGLSDAGSCSKWKTGFPVDLVKIRDIDEQYWTDYRGSPKAYISLKTAEKLWSNRFGSYTALRLPAGKISLNQLNKDLSSIANPQTLGINVEGVKNQAQFAASNGTDFSQLFMGLSFFILVAGILLTAMLFVLSAEQRKVQTGTFSALGLSKKIISKIYITEASLVATIGAVFGIFLAVIYNQLIFNALNHLWGDIVRTDVLEVKINAKTLLYGGFAGIEVSVITIWVMLIFMLRNKAFDLQKQRKIGVFNKKISLIKTIIIVVSVILGVVLIVNNLINDKYLNASTYFGTGMLWMIAFFLGLDKYFIKIEKSNKKDFNINSLATKNRIRNRKRSLSIIALLTIGTFLVVSTGINRKDLSQNADKKESGTGGFTYVSKSVIPLVHDLNSEKYKAELGITIPFLAIPFREISGDDASCLNLNKISNPKILGVDPLQLKDRFSFETFIEKSDISDTWMELSKKRGDLIPAIADQTVIQWGLGKKIGDTLFYKNANGYEMKLLLIGGLESSVFQGNVIIDSKFLLENYPNSSGNAFFLIDTDTSNAETLKNELFYAFRDFGWQMTKASDVLAEFKSVENTYLTIFLMLGGLGLFIGSIGFAIVITRNIRERKKELAFILSVGFSRKDIIKLIFRENIFLLLTGIIAGLVLAIISTIPSFVYNFSHLPILFLFLAIMAIIINGVVWIVLTTLWNTRNIYPASELKND